MLLSALIITVSAVSFFVFSLCFFQKDTNAADAPEWRDDGKAYRYWFLTENDPDFDLYADKFPLPLDSKVGYKYAKFAHERGGHTERDHVHAWVVLTRNQRFAWMKKRFPRAHLEPQKGSHRQMDDYLDGLKDGERKSGETFAVWEKGDRDVVKGRILDNVKGTEALKAVKEAIDQGAKEFELWESYFSTMCRYHNGILLYMERKGRFDRELSVSVEKE